MILVGGWIDFEIHVNARARKKVCGGAGLVSRSILIDLGLFYRLFQKNGLYLVYILIRSLL